MNNIRQVKEEIGRELRERGSKLLEQDDYDLTIQRPKPQGNPQHDDNKRFYLDSQVVFVCPQCGTQCVHDLSEIPLSYPEFNVPFDYTCYCEQCQNEWKANCQLVLHVELQAVKPTR